MIREAVIAALALGASVAAAVPHSRAVPPPTRGTRVAMPAPHGGGREFQFRGLVFTIPATWTVERGDQQQFRSELVTVTGHGSGPRLTFSESVRAVGGQPMPAVGPGARERSAGGLALDRYQMPNPVWRGVLYVFPDARISVTAQVRTEADARAADAVMQSARRALPPPRPTRS
jgi:hypothetical protein